MQVVIWSNSHKEMLEWIHVYGKVLKYTQPFFYKQRIIILERDCFRQSESFGIKCFKISEGKFAFQNRLGLYLEWNLCLKIDWASL